MRPGPGGTSHPPGPAQRTLNGRIDPMSWFTGKQSAHAGGRKSTRIDPSTGRNKRDKVTQRSTHGGPPRQLGTGKAVNRAGWRRAQKTRGWFS